MTIRPYVRPMPKSWWMHESRFVRYMIREATCLFICFHALILLLGVYRLSQGRDAFDAFLAALWSPGGQIMSAVILLMAVVHSVTWFNLTPKAMPLWIGDRKVPGWVIVGGHYGGWIVVSAAVLFLAGGLS